MANIAVAVSGGVDSLGALLRLKRAGHKVLAIHGLFSPNAEIPSSLATICQNAGVDFIVADLRPQFQIEVMNYFKEEYAKGRTPNPCAICNRAIKFGGLLKFALAAGAERFATGHYAALDSASYHNPVLANCMDADKDQSYFLSLVEAQHLKYVLFPLAGQTKAQTRREVAAAGFAPPSNAESQDICFLPKTHKKAERFHAEPGPILLRTEKDLNAPPERLPVLGSHNGLGNYTPGQRRGLRVPWREPLYACELDIPTNSLIVGPRNMVEIRGVTLGSLNLFVEPESWPARLFIRLRYRQPLREVNIDFSGSEVKIELKQTCFTTAPGQIGAIYDQQGHILAGGIIEKVLRSPSAQ